MINTLRSFVIKRLPLAIFLIIYLILALVTSRDFGLTMDEFFVYTRGEYFYTKVVGNDAFLQKGFVVNEGGNEDILYNNSSYPALLYMLNNNGSYEQYHLINILMASLIFILMYEVLLFVTSKPLYAIVGPIMLFFTPRFLGHIPANPKDIPFAIGYFVSLTMIFLSMKWREKIQLIVLGLVIGLTASIRIIGFTLIPIYILFKLLHPLELDVSGLIKRAVNVALESVILFLISYLIFLANMPYVAADPINHFFELIRVNAQYPWYGDILFFGKTLSFDKRPLSYLLVWFLITTPLYILGLSIYGVWKKMTAKAQTLKLLILISLGVQTLFYIILKPVIYNGLRHYLFILPHLVLLAALGYREIVENKKLQKWAWAALGIVIVFMISSYWMLHPYEYTYFNLLTNGVRGAQDNFELDYWAASDKEAMMWLADYLNQNNITNVAVFSCSKSASLSYYMPQVADVNTNIQKAEYIICYDRKKLSIIQKNMQGTILHETKRDNVVYSTILQVVR